MKLFLVSTRESCKIKISQQKLNVMSVCLSSSFNAAPPLTKKLEAETYCSASRSLSCPPQNRRMHSARKLRSIDRPSFSILYSTRMFPTRFSPFEYGKYVGHGTRDLPEFRSALGTCTCRTQLLIRICTCNPCTNWPRNTFWNDDASHSCLRRIESCSWRRFHRSISTPLNLLSFRNLIFNISMIQRFDFKIADPEAYPRDLKLLRAWLMVEENQRSSLRYQAKTQNLSVKFHHEDRRRCLPLSCCLGFCLRTSSCC